MFSKQTSKTTQEGSAALVAQFRRQRIITMLTFVVTLSMLAVSSAAWFAINRNVDSNGMKVQTELSPNLVIASSAALVRETTIDSSRFSITFGDRDTIIKPSTHDAGSPTGLVYVSNQSVIHPLTGYASGGSILFENVTGENGERFFEDFDVYIASHGQELPVNHLYAKLNCDDINQDYQYAASIDFYVGSVAGSNYKGTLNLSDMEKEKKVDLTGSTTVPLNTAESNNYIKVVMRCYFDGALEKETNQAYIRSSSLNIDNFSMCVEFEADNNSLFI